MRLITAMLRSTRPVGSTFAGYVHAALCVLLGSVLVATASARPQTKAASGAGPTIYSVAISPTVAHAGDAVRWDAHVSPNVVSVTARVAVYSFTLYPTRAGHFGETIVLPKDVPPFFRGNYGITITAKTASGAAAYRSVSMSFQ